MKDFPLSFLLGCCLLGKAEAGNTADTPGTNSSSGPDPFATNLTGDWGGFRGSLADRGFTLGLESTHFYQGLLGGDGDSSFDYGGRLDARIALDTGKLGLWEGGSFHSHVEYRHGDLSAFRSRGLMV